MSGKPSLRIAVSRKFVFDLTFLLSSLSVVEKRSLRCNVAKLNKTFSFQSRSKLKVLRWGDSHMLVSLRGINQDSGPT